MMGGNGFDGKCCPGQHLPDALNTVVVKGRGSTSDAALITGQGQTRLGSLTDQVTFELGKRTGDCVEHLAHG